MPSYIGDWVTPDVPRRLLLLHHSRKPPHIVEYHGPLDGEHVSIGHAPGEMPNTAMPADNPAVTPEKNAVFDYGTSIWRYAHPLRSEKGRYRGLACLVPPGPR